MKKIVVLLSTYNGEKYIGQLLDSLKEQTWPDIELFIRDDGSTDNTVSLIESYADQLNLTLIRGENAGYKKSFYWLLENCPDADYYAYCDQDDIWLPHKLSRAVKHLEPWTDVPSLYLCDFYWSDENCVPQRTNRNTHKVHTLQKAITSGDMNTFGFSEVFNRKAAQAVKGHAFMDHCVHDQIVYLYCLCNGKTIWDPKPGVYYRRFGGNASVQEYVGGTRLSHFIWRLKTFLLHSSRDTVYERYREFFNAFGEELPPEDQEIFRRYLNRDCRLKKAFYPGIYRDTFIDDMSIRLLFLLGRM